MIPHAVLAGNLLPTMFNLPIIALVAFLLRTSTADDFQFMAYDSKVYAEVGQYLLQGLNNQSKPCENFFDHVCGNYQKSKGNDTPPKSREVYLWNDEQARFDALAMDLIKKIDAKSPSTIDYNKNLKIFFDRCTTAAQDSTKSASARRAESNESSSSTTVPDWRCELIESIAERLEIKDWIEKLDVVEESNMAAVWKFMGKLKRQFKVWTLSDARISDGPSILIVPAASIDDCESLAKHTSRIVEDLSPLFPNLSISQLLEAHFPKIKSLCEELKAGVNVEKQLHDLQQQTVFDRTKLSWTKPMANFNDSEYLLGLFPRKHDAVFLVNEVDLYSVQGAMESQATILKERNIATIKLFALYMLYEKLPDLNTSVMDEAYCYSQARQHFAPAIAKLFLTHFKTDGSSIRFGIKKLSRSIFAAFRFLLNTIDWIDDENRERIQEALDTITVDPGLPKWIDDDQEIMRRVIQYDDAVDFFENRFKGNERLLDRVMDSMKDGTFVAEPFSYTFVYPKLTVGAYFLHDYYAFINQGPKLHVQAPFGFPPVFNNKNPAALAFGGLGSIIAHELMHMFHASSGPLWDPTGRRPLIKESAMASYKTQQECLAEDYSRYCSPDNKRCLDGSKTIDEDIPDIAGLKIAYAAYKITAMVENENARIKGMEHYTHDQLFFIANARGWCERGFEAAHAEDVHSPNIARVEVAYRHVLPFAEAFGCKPGSKYVASKDCNIWGHIENIDQHDLTETHLGNKTEGEKKGNDTNKQ